MIVSLTKCIGKPPYNEVFQQTGVRFTFCKEKSTEKYEEVFYPVLCRDYLGDVIWAEKYDKQIEIYGFSYDGKKKKNLYEDKTLLGLTFSGNMQKEKFLRNMSNKCFNKVEEGNRLKPTEILETDQKEALIVKGDPFWTTTSWGISLYTLMLRLACSSDTNKEQCIFSASGNQLGREHTYVKAMRKFLDKDVYNFISKMNYAGVTGWEGEEHNAIDWDTIHNMSGILYMIQNDAYADRSNNLYRKQFRKFVK